MTENREALSVSLFSEILALEHLIRAKIDKALPKGTELSHFSVLNHLAHVDDERQPAQLAQALNLTRGAMSNTLSKLEAAGHVHIRPDWNDARRKLVSISPAGRLALETALAKVAPLLMDLSSELAMNDLRSTIPVLRSLRQRLSEKA
ncbi:MAG: MarR family winged helix-turn-helix transcriptional regulator [Planktomarina sp.]